MKYLIVLASGMADEPLEELDNRTPLAAAHTPALDELAKAGKTGCSRTLPDRLPVSEEVALLSALGYDPHKYFSGEAGLAVADSGLALGADRLPFMHNLATEDNGVLLDHAAGQVSPQEAESLLTSLSAALGRPEFQFHVGRGFAGVTVLPIPEGEEPACDPPEAALGLAIEKHLPRERSGDILRKLIGLSRDVFREHEVNRVRADLGENPANLLWLWGPGRPPVLPSFESCHKLSAAMIAAAESARGLGRLCAMRVPHVAGATGSYRTDYAAKAQAALELIYEVDLVILHVASPADASLEGNTRRKLATIEDIDAMIVQPLLQHAQRKGDTRILFLPTHVASVKKRKRTCGPVPVAMFGPGLEPMRQAGFSELAAQAGELDVKQAHELLPYFLTR